MTTRPLCEKKKKNPSHSPHTAQGRAADPTSKHAITPLSHHCLPGPSTFSATHKRWPNELGKAFGLMLPADGRPASRSRTLNDRRAPAFIYKALYLAISEKRTEGSFFAQYEVALRRRPRSASGRDCKSHRELKECCMTRPPYRPPQVQYPLGVVLASHYLCLV